MLAIENFISMVTDVIADKTDMLLDEQDCGYSVVADGHGATLTISVYYDSTLSVEYRVASKNVNSIVVDSSRKILIFVPAVYDKERNILSVSSIDDRAADRVADIALSLVEK